MEKTFEMLLLKGALPVDPFDLSKAFTVISSVYQEKMQTFYRLFDETSGVEEAENSLQDDEALRQILSGLKDWYHEESHEQYLSLCWRIFALCQLIREDVLSEWVKFNPSDGNILIPGVVVLTAASVPLQAKDGFDRSEFLETVHLYQDR